MSKPVRLHSGEEGAIFGQSGNKWFAGSAAVPTDGGAGYEPGCLYLHTDSSGATSLYKNIGTATSCNFDPLLAGASGQGAALTAAKPTFTIADAEGTPDNAIAAVTSTTPFGFSNAAELITLLYKVQNLHTRVGEIEVALEGAGIVAAN